ncbi:hypothetical protein ACQJBY_048862 [Aegilops geniculata]
MVELTSRCLAFAEGIVTMVCPVLLALSLKKNKETPLSMPMLVVAGATLVTGICPMLACCISEMFPKTCVRWPSVTRGLAATISSVCLIVLACWIALRVVSKDFVFIVGFLSWVCLFSRAVTYWTRSAEQRQRQRQQINGVVASSGSETAKGLSVSEEKRELSATVDKSHEFLSGVTGILFLWLEGLTLEGLVNTRDGTLDALRLHMKFSLIICALGVSLMFFQMIPPRAASVMKGLVYFTDLAMAVGTGALLVIIMVKLMGVIGLLFLVSPVLIFLQLLYIVKIRASKLPISSPLQSNPDAGGNSDGNNQGEESLAKKNQGEESKQAPLGLTKVTFAGFLAVSVKAIGSDGSPSEWTVCFLLFTAAAIASGVSWRLLTHTHNKSRVGGKAAADEAANFASFCTHFCVAVATVLFAVMVWNEDVCAACAHVSELTGVHLNKTLDVQHVKDMCACIFCSAHP